MTVAELTDEQRAFLTEVLPQTRDEAGRYLPGFNGGARQRRKYDFRSAIARHLESTGGSVQDVLVSVFNSLLLQAQLGSIEAAKVLLDRFCGKDVDVVDITVAASTMSDTERAARISAILSAAAARNAPRITVSNG